MDHRARRVGLICCGWAAILLLAASGGAWAQRPASSAPAGEGPSGVQQASGPAERLGQAGQPATAEARPAPRPGRGHRLWLDKVHAVGLFGGGLMVTNFIIGLSILLGALAGTARFPVLKRKGRRKWHYLFGLTALSLAVLHGVLRYVQFGGLQVHNPPAFALGCTAALLACSGMVRAWPPRKLARHPKVWTWVHRTLLALAVVLLAVHVTGQVLRLLG
jgi:hypothetical protein